MSSGKYTEIQIIDIMKILIDSIHGMLMFFISGNDEIKLEDVYKDLELIIEKAFSK